MQIQKNINTFRFEIIVLPDDGMEIVEFSIIKSIAKSVYLYSILYAFIKHIVN